MNLFNFIKSQISILNLISEYTTLRQTGIYWKGICPFHNEKTPSFTVSPHKEIFYCFGCHIGGDVITFISKIENCSQIEAAKFLADKNSIDIPKEVNKELNNVGISSNEKEKYFLICKLVLLWCHENLKVNKNAFKYIKSRGIHDKTIDTYSIGYFPSGLNSIKKLLEMVKNHGFLAQDLINASILLESKNSLYSSFEERVIFPIKDNLGRVCGFGGRIYKDNDERAKYYNSHENQNFSKGSILYGLDLAKKHIQERGHVFLVEGYIDCIAMAQYGYPNTVAILGTSCTTEHLKILSRFTYNIYILYDSDNAGLNAILRLTEMCWNVNMELKVISLENGEDPASFLIKNGKLRDFIDLAKDIYTFFIENSCKGFDYKPLNEKVWTVKKLTDIIHNIDDQIKKEILLQEVTKKLNIPLDSIKKSNVKDGKLAINQLSSTVLKNKINEDMQIPNLEKNIFRAIMNNFELFNHSYYYISNFFSSPIKEILSSLIELKTRTHSLDFNDLMNILDDKQRGFINKSLLESEDYLLSNFEEMIIKFQKNNWKKITNIAKQELLQAQKNCDMAAADKIISDFEKLKNKFIQGGLL